MTNVKDLLPIGSVIRLREATKRLMIFGVKQTNTDTNTDYDYIGVIYPEGNIGGETQIMFNHEDIEELYFRGYEDEERAAFIERLADFYARLT